MARSTRKRRLNLRDSQVQARLGLISSIASAVFVLMLAFLVLQRFDPSDKTIIYNPKSGRLLAILGATALSAFLAAIGFGMGLSSLGHKRNARQRESWIGFLLGALVMCLAIILFALFRMFALKIIA